MRIHNNARRYSANEQLMFLKAQFKNNGTYTSLAPGKWSWKWKCKPREMSPFYNFRLVYDSNSPHVFITDHLELHNTETKLPHVYNQQKQEICLFYPKACEWNNTMKITIIVPWISEWLYFYESWLITGVWYGGGIHHGKLEKS